VRFDTDISANHKLETVPRIGASTRKTHRASIFLLLEQKQNNIIDQFAKT
jgi:hypothetical protein